jgi:lysyl-tRNA synthetase class 2
MLNESIKPDIVRIIAEAKATLIKRAGIISSVRSFFDSNDFCEVDTPIAIKSPAPEEFIESLQAGGLFLRPSPELQMKIMLVAGWEKIYQIGSCFRAGEFGCKHRPEFTMLEWYQSSADYCDLISFTTVLLQSLAKTISESGIISYKNQKIDFNRSPEIISVNDAFVKYCGVTAQQALDEDNFDLLMVSSIEPNLGLGCITFLKDYPCQRGALAKICENNSKYAERWELYIAGLEIANAYTELIDSVEQEKRFEQANQFREKNKMINYPEQTDFLEAMRYGMPPAAGCALGIDRLVMILTDNSDIANVKIPLS